MQTGTSNVFAVLNWMHAILHNVRLTPDQTTPFCAHIYMCKTVCSLNRYIIMHNWAKDVLIFFHQNVVYSIPMHCRRQCTNFLHFILTPFKPVNCQLVHWSPNHSICKANSGCCCCIFIGCIFFFFRLILWLFGDLPYSALLGTCHTIILIGF